MKFKGFSMAECLYDNNKVRLESALRHYATDYPIINHLAFAHSDYIPDGIIDFTRREVQRINGAGLLFGLYYLNAGDCKSGNWRETERGYGTDIEFFLTEKGAIAGFAYHRERLFKTLEAAKADYESRLEWFKSVTPKELTELFEKHKGELV